MICIHCGLSPEDALGGACESLSGPSHAFAGKLEMTIQRERARETEVALAAAEREIARLRNIIKTGGASYRAERSAMGIPGGIDPDSYALMKRPDQEPK